LLLASGGNRYFSGNEKKKKRCIFKIIKHCIVKVDFEAFYGPTLHGSEYTNNILHFITPAFSPLSIPRDSTQTLRERERERERVGIVCGPANQRSLFLLCIWGG